MMVRGWNEKAELERVLLLSIWTGVILVLLMPLVVSEKTLFPFIVGKAIYSRAMIEIVFGLWVLLAYKYPSYRLPRSWLLVAFAIYLVVALLAGATGVSFQRSLWSTYERMQGLVDLAHWFLFVLVVASAFRSMRDWRYLLNANLAVSLVMALLGVAQRYDVSLPIYEFLERADRLDITLGNPTFVGAYMLVNVFIGMALLSHSFHPPSPEAIIAVARRRRRRRRARSGRGDGAILWWRLFWITTIALNLWMLVLSGTRGAFIGMLAALVAIGVAYVLWGQITLLKRLALGLLSFVVVVTLVFAFARDTEAFKKVADSSVMLSRVAELDLHDRSVVNRLEAHRAGVEGFMARPLLGWGPENYIVAWANYFDPGPDVNPWRKQVFDQAHNKLLEELTTKGLLGFSSYVAVWGLVFWVIVRRLRRQDARQQFFTLFMGAALVGYFVQNLFLFDTPATVLQFILLLAFAVSLDSTIEAPGLQRPPIGSGKSRDDADALASPQGSWRDRLQPFGQAIYGSLGIDRLGRSLGRARQLRGKALGAYGVALVLLLVPLSIYAVNYRPFVAAIAVVQTDNAGTWDEARDRFERSIDSFPPLANYPRRFLFEAVARNWDGLSEEQAQGAISLVEEEGRRALEAEPRGWMQYVRLTNVYQKASSIDPRYLERARQYLDKAAELAPETLQVALLQEQQQRLEKGELGSREASGQ